MVRHRVRVEGFRGVPNLDRPRGVRVRRGAAPGVTARARRLQGRALDALPSRDRSLLRPTGGLVEQRGVGVRVGGAALPRGIQPPEHPIPLPSLQPVRGELAVGTAEGRVVLVRLQRPRRRRFQRRDRRRPRPPELVENHRRARHVVASHARVVAVKPQRHLRAVNRRARAVRAEALERADVREDHRKRRRARRLAVFWG